MSTERVDKLLNQWRWILERHTNHKAVKKAMATAALPNWYADTEQGIPWCIHCGAKMETIDGRFLGHSEECLAPHLRWLMTGYKRLIEQGWELHALLQELEDSDLKPWDGPEDGNIDSDGVLYGDRIRAALDEADGDEAGAALAAARGQTVDDGAGRVVESRGADDLPWD